jgi:hypothetical protein
MFLQVQGITMWSKTKHVIQLTGQFIQLNILVAYIEYEIYIYYYLKKKRWNYFFSCLCCKLSICFFQLALATQCATWVSIQQDANIYGIFTFSLRIRLDRHRYKDKKYIYAFPWCGCNGPVLCIFFYEEIKNRTIFVNFVIISNVSFAKNFTL